MQTGVWHSTQHGQHPQHEDDPLDVGACGHVFDFERVHHGYVALHAECSDVEDRSKAHRLKQEGFKVAASLPEQEGVVLPHVVEL